MQYQVPVFAQVDLIVVGGASGGVAAAAAAARPGCRIFLGAAEPYLGEDLCATGRLWLAGDVPLETDLARKLFTTDEGTRRTFVEPITVKRLLDEALLETGVTFRFGVVPADLLVDAAGRLAGVLFTSSSGPFAVTARQVIDATPAALCARLASVPFTPWPAEGTLRFARVIIGGGGRPAAAPDAPDAAPADVQTEALGEIRFEDRDRMVACQAYRHQMALTLPAFTPEAVAAAEQTLRDHTWDPETLWSSDRADWMLPDAMESSTSYEWTGAATVDLAAFRTPITGLSILGTCAALPRDAAAQLALAPVAITIGERLGQATKEGESPILADCRTMLTGIRDPLLHEPANHPRPPAATTDWITHDPATLPHLGTYDVVVAGGGTGGAPAAIAAARAGARVLLLETLHELGGLGTLGCITHYWYGNCDSGFTQEMTRGLRELGGNDPAFHPGRWNPVHKAEWMRREFLKAGGTLWFGATVSGVQKSGSHLGGVIVNTPWGRGLVRATVVIDATGNADVAAAAGAECLTVSDVDLAIQGSGLPSIPFVPGYHNTDYTFIEDSDLLDTTRAFIVAHRRFRHAFDLSPIPGTRERRQIVGDATVTPLDVYAGRTWSDSICLSRSNFDSHGFTVHPIFFVQPPDHTCLDAWLPLRALLPRGVSALLVTGLAISGQRDVMPVFRMQGDVQNHAYAAGLAAVMALACKGEVRRIDVRALQRGLIETGFLPQTVLLHRDPAPVARPVLNSAARGPLDIHAEIAGLLTYPEAARLLLRQRFASETDPDIRGRCARLLAVIGDYSGADWLMRQLRAATEWDEGWNYRGMGQFGRSVSPLDEIILLLALARVGEAKGAVLEKIGQLGPDPALSHIRAIAVYCETFPDAEFAAALERLLESPGISHHAWTMIEEELADIPESTTDNTTRNRSLRELYLLRALWRCGDPRGVAAPRLARYTSDIRGHFARHARRILDEPRGRRPRNSTHGALNS